MAAKGHSKFTAFFIFLFAFLMLHAFGFSALAAEQESFLTGRYNLRRGPALGYGVIRTMRKDDTVKVLGRQGDWYRILTERGDSGWVWKDGVATRTAKTKDCAECNERKQAAPNSNVNNLDQISSALKEKGPPSAPTQLRPKVNPPPKPASNPVIKIKAPPAKIKATPLVDDKAACLVDAAKFEATRCRNTASFVRDATGSDVLCGMEVSKGRCYEGVKQALIRSNILTYMLPGASAYEAHTQGHLIQAGMVEVTGKYTTQNAPVGAVMVYSGGPHGHGHIEVKSGNSLYCSDYCSARPVIGRTLMAIYMFPEDKR